MTIFSVTGFESAPGLTYVLVHFGAILTNQLINATAIVCILFKSLATIFVLSNASVFTKQGA